MKYISSYASASGSWIRGNFHSHCQENSSCGFVPLEQAVGQYASLPIQALALTDHNFITDKAEMQTRFPDIFLLNGFEHSQGRDMLFIGTNDKSLCLLPLPAAMKSAEQAGQGRPIMAICHPDPMLKGDYWTLEMIKSLAIRPDCIEVYNGHYSVPRLRAMGRQPLHTHIWDSLLSDGCRIWGIANDDFHDPPDFNNAFTMLRVPAINRDTIVNALRQGHCYASTGLYLRDMRVNGNVIEVDACQPCDGRFIGPGGVELASAADEQFFRYKAQGEAYIRFEAKSEKGLLFTQPAFLE